MPIEFREVISVFTLQNMPIEILSQLVVDNNLPIDIVGETRIWVLDRRGVIWAVPERGNEWIRVGQSDTWIINERGNSCS